MNFFAFCIVFGILMATTKNPGLAIAMGIVFGVIFGKKKREANRNQNTRKKK